MSVDPALLARLPLGYIMRPLDESDFDRGFLECLAQLASVGHVTRDIFATTLSSMQAAGSYYVIVILNAAGVVVACATLVVELKFLRECSKAGHVEDVVVSASERGRGLGQILLAYLVDCAIQLGCYKVLLNCADDKVGFYEKAGFSRHGLQMKRYL